MRTTQVKIIFAQLDLISHLFSLLFLLPPLFRLWPNYRLLKALQELSATVLSSTSTDGVPVRSLGKLTDQINVHVFYFIIKKCSIFPHCFTLLSSSIFSQNASQYIINNVMNSNRDKLHRLCEQLEPTVVPAFLNICRNVTVTYSKKKKRKISFVCAFIEFLSIFFLQD